MLVGILYLVNEIKVKNIIIGKQFENTENYKKFIEIVKKKHIKVNVVEQGVKFNIEKNIFFDVLWPNSMQEISENVINNNALVCKLNYKNFTMLFTGDIEEKAEKILVSNYKNTNILESKILKVAHHGSNTSSTQEFLELVKPKIALIGVGKNNTFGHPNDEVIERIKTFGAQIYRTDEDGEIEILVNRKQKVKIKRYLYKFNKTVNTNTKSKIGKE